MSAPLGWRKRVSKLLATLTATLVVASGVALAPTAALAAPTAVVTPTVTSVNAEASMVVNVEASGLPTDVTNAYAALIEKGTSGNLSDPSSGSVAFALPFPTVTEGSSSFTLEAPIDKLDRTKVYEVVIWRIHSGVNDETLYGLGDVPISEDQWNQLYPTPDPEPTEPEPEPEPEPTDPQPTDPEPTDPEPTEPDPTDPELTDPELTDPDPTDPEPTTPTVTVEKTEDIDPAGEMVTVSGTGFVENAPGTTGTRPPLAGKFAGSYVVFGFFLDDWRPSEGAPGKSRDVVSQKWAVPGESMATIGGDNSGAIELNADGTFETELLLKPDEAKGLEGGNWGVATYPGSGAAYAGFETFTPVTFAAEEEPSSPFASAAVVDASENGLQVQFDGEGFTESAAPDGVYVAVVEKGAEPARGSETTPAVAYVTVPNLVDGKLDHKLDIEASKLDRSKAYEAIVWKAHGDATPESTYSRAALEVTESDWDALFPKSGPTASAEVVGASDAGLQVQFDGEGFTPEVTRTGVYVAVVPAGETPGHGSTTYVTLDQLVNGTLDSEVLVAKADLDRSKSYDFVVWKAHSALTDETLFSRGNLEVSEVNWDAVFPVDGPSGTAEVADASESGLTVQVELEGLDSEALSNGLYVGLIEAGTAESASMASIVGTEWVRSVPEAGMVSQEVVAAAERLDRSKSYEVIVWEGHTLPGEDTVLTVLPLEVSEVNWDAVFKATEPEVPEDQEEGSLEWGIRETFRNYVTGPIAQGKITVSKPATQNADKSTYKFPQIDGGSWNGSTGTVKYAGNVHFSGHDGVLDLNLNNPTIAVKSETAAEVHVQHDGKNMVIAKINLRGSSHLRV